jgi:hypothetical protein
MPGIAAATGTMMDSAAKHTLACRVDEDRMHALADATQILQNKYKYCVNRHELVLNSGNEWAVTSKTTAAAYPSVMSNFGDIDPVLQTLLSVLYRSMDTPQKLAMARKILDNIGSFSFTNPKHVALQNQCRALPFCHVQGYSLGVAYANHRQGDIVCAVQVGGMISVRNGHYECQTGEMVQWYFEWETPMFYGEDSGEHRTGERCYDPAPTEAGWQNLDASSMLRRLRTLKLGERYAPGSGTSKRKRHVDLQLGVPNCNGKSNIPYPKPYVVSTQHGEHYGDRIRVFAKCVNGGRAHDMIDIMLMTQSL